MARRIQTSTATLCGGGPADGERRPIEDGVATVLVREPVGPGPVSLADAVRAHVYERADDGRFVYGGTVLRLPEVPETIGDDAPALAPAPSQRDARCAGAVATAVLIVVVAVAMACFGALA